MRADRILSLLLLLQTHGELTAQELADELEVSVRTIYRDMTALSAAGAPVYAERGPGGGCRLVPEYRTSLTGLTAPEIDALRLLNLPDSLAPLEAGRQLKSALLKLFAAMPGGGRERTRKRYITLDWSGWGFKPAPLPFLNELYQAAVHDRRASIRYALWNRVEVEQVADVYGLAAKAGDWHLVYNSQGKFQTQRVAVLLGARILPETFVRPPDYDLDRAWAELCREIELHRPSYTVLLRVDPATLGQVMQVLARGGQPVSEVLSGPGDPWTRLRASFESLEGARAVLLSLGGAVEVIEPLPLRWSMRDFAEQVMEQYVIGEFV
jgi:predicted DNA-binding transcriptional regulator YafY